MKKGETYTGRVQHVDFPNKAVVFTESENPEENGQKVIVKTCKEPLCVWKNT